MELYTNLNEVLRQHFGRLVTHDGERDLYEVFGYPDKVSIKKFRHAYKRGGIAQRIVEAYPKSCWADLPRINNEEDAQERNAWEMSADALLEELDFWKHVKRLDMMTQLGRYALLYIGFSDVTDKQVLNKPVPSGVKPKFLKVLAEDVASVDKLEKDPTKKRFGMPLTYNVNMENETQQSVHHTRVIHVAERKLDDDIYGTPVLESIWNYLIDLQKVIGSSAEIFWLNGRGGLSLEADADTEIKDPEKLKNEVDKFQHNLTRVIKTQGVDVKPIVSNVPSPKDNVETLFQAIAATTGIPTRILSGSERGELASSQDEKNWNDRVDERRKDFCESDILNPFVRKMIEVGALEDDGFQWEWSELDNVSAKDQSEIAKNKAAALAGYANSPEADSIVGNRQFVEDVLNLEYREDELAEPLGDEESNMDDIDNERPD